MGTSNGARGCELRAAEQLQWPAGHRWQLERSNAVEFRLEVVRIPVSDMDRAKDFYQELGWRLDFDFRSEDGTRSVQVTPPGSACSVFFSTGIAPGQDLVVDDIDAAQAELTQCGAEVSGYFTWMAPRGPRPGTGPRELRLIHLVQRPRR